MLNTILPLFLLWMPGFCASEYLRYLKHDKRSVNLTFFSDTFLFSFVILGLNVGFKYVIGGAAEIFSLTQLPYTTSFLTKYIALSLVFALLLPHIILMVDIKIKALQNRKHEK